mgnify:CR=1 FL=1|tara:strand:- start:1023 stop:1385 length:363 start_codon:yes stop_codon:yes gene_type:complete
MASGCTTAPGAIVGSPIPGDTALLKPYYTKAEVDALVRVATRVIAIPAAAASLTVDAANFGQPLTWLPSRVIAELIGPDEIAINSKEFTGGSLTTTGDVIYHFRGAPAGATHSLELHFYP